MAFIENDGVRIHCNVAIPDAILRILEGFTQSACNDIVIPYVAIFLDGDN